MNLQEIIENLNLTVLTTPKDFSKISPQHGYTSDLLSCVMAGAKKDGLWLTLQSHANIVAVAALLDLSAIIITEGAQPDGNTLARANEQNITLLATPLNSYSAGGMLWELGLRD